jgi:hypothetical protein
MKLSNISSVRTLSSERSLIENETHYLPFRNLYKIDLSSFLKESFYFGTNNFAIIICFAIIEIMFVTYNISNHIFEMGLAIYIIKLIFCFSYQFIWVSGIILTPFYIRREFGKYHMYLRLLFLAFIFVLGLNMVLYLIFMNYIDEYKEISQLMMGSVFIMKYFAFMNIPLLAFSNFLRGIFDINS